MKHRRNESCWCGSGKKYKHCHLNRDREPKPSIEQMLNFQRSLGTRKLCMHPEASTEVCSETIVKAHTIQKSGSLKAIAEDHEVMTFTSDLIPMMQSGGIPVERVVKIKSASTFTGFCEVHDGPTFAPFETAPFVGSAEQCFLMSYRALCRELYGKHDYAGAVQTIRNMDGGLTDDEQFQFQASRLVQELMVRVGLKDLLREKQIHDEMLKARDFNHLEAYVLTLDKTPDVVTSSFLSPTKDFNDVELQDLAEITVPVHGVGFNLLSTQTGGVAVLTWVKTAENVGRALAESLHGLDINDQPDALIRFAFSQTDNSHFSKSWWNRLSEAEKAGVRRLIAQDIHPFADPTSLVDTGLRLASFKVQRQERHWQSAEKTA